MKWFPDWSNEVAVVLGSGPSVDTETTPKLLRNTKVVAVNNSIFLYPIADVCFATDVAWWDRYLDHVRKGSPYALRVCTKGVAGTQRIHVPKPDDKRRPTIIMEPKGLIGSGGNSGFQALNLVVQFGAKKIILVGFDMSVDRGLHWHGEHAKGLRNPEAPLIEKWRQALDKQAPALKDAGIHVINASPYSALTAYPKFKLEEALQCFGKSRSTVHV